MIQWHVLGASKRTPHVLDLRPKREKAILAIRSCIRSHEYGRGSDARSRTQGNRTEQVIPPSPNPAFAWTAASKSFKKKFPVPDAEPKEALTGYSLIAFSKLAALRFHCPTTEASTPDMSFGVAAAASSVTCPPMKGTSASLPFCKSLVTVSVRVTPSIVGRKPPKASLTIL